MKKRKAARGCGKGHIFDNPEKKEEMLAYRTAGYSYPQLALYYNVDHSTLIYHVKKAGIPMVDQMKKDKIISAVKNGKNIYNVAKTFSVTPSLVSVYCSQAKLNQKILPSEKKLVLKMAPKWGRPSPYNFHINYTKTKKSIRPGWIADLDGSWVCAGKPISQIQKEQEERREKIAVQQRLEMLRY